VNPIVETRFMVQRELRKTFRSVKGILLSLFTIAGGGGLALLFAQSDDLRQKRLNEKNISPEALLDLKKHLFGWWFMDKSTGEHLGRAPTLLVFLFGVSLVLMPALVLLLGFDSVSGERQHKTVRYWTLRSRRSSYVVSKWLGLWATCGIVAFGMHLLIWIVCMARGEAPAADIIGWGIRFWLAGMPILGMWCAVAVFISSLLRVPILALLSTAGVFFAWWLIYSPFWVKGHNEDPELGSMVSPSAILYLYPNFYDRFMLSPQLGAFLTGLAVTFGFAAVMLAAASALFARRDV
jgi:ABC-2 type transport system permease protein